MDFLIRKLLRKLNEETTVENARAFYITLLRTEANEPTYFYSSDYSTEEGVESTFHASREGAYIAAAEKIQELVAEVVEDEILGNMEAVELADNIAVLFLEDKYKEIVNLYENSFLYPSNRIAVHTEILRP